MSSSDEESEVVIPYSQRGDAEDMLAAWLKVHAPRDVLMPTAAPGEKRPRTAHADGSWTWARYGWLVHCRKVKARRRERRWGPRAPRVHDPRPDVGILLRDLCVIDCDTPEAAAALEEVFPEELAAAPCARTARGRHYYLRRSPLADSHGYFYGASQRVRGVDFKTRARSGVSGFVVAPPSTNKARADAASDLGGGHDSRPCRHSV